MSIWAQIDDVRVMEIPPDGKTATQVYASFSFSGAPIPEGSPVNFLIGIGDLPKDPDGALILDLAAITAAITPLPGVTLNSQVAGVENQVVKDEQGNPVVLPVASVTIQPISNKQIDKITVVAYSTFDKLGLVARLQAQQLDLNVTSVGGTFLSVMERYDPVGNAWSTKASMPTGRSGLFGGSVGGKIYAIGGFNGDFAEANEAYDPGTDSWAEVEPMPRPRAFGGTAVVGGLIYCVGGYNGNRANRASAFLDAYDPAMDAWTLLPDLPQPVAFGAVEAIGNFIYVSHGATQVARGLSDSSDHIGQFNPAVYRYDVSGGTWSTMDVVVATPTTTALSADAPAGSTFFLIPNGAQFPPYGVVTVDSETIPYSLFDGVNGILRLVGVTQSAHLAGPLKVRLATIPESRMTPSSYSSGSKMRVFDGKSFLGFDSAAPDLIRSSEVEFDTASGAFAATTATTNLPRYRAGAATLAGSVYVAGGSATKSSWVKDVEIGAIGSPTTFFGPAGVAKMTFERNSLSMVADGGFVYAIGGDGSGHPPGWLQITCEADPSEVLADGKATSSVTVTAVDASGDPPPDGTAFRAQGIVYVSLTEKEQEAAEVASTAGATTAVQTSTGQGAQKQPAPRISILPVLFSSRDMTMVGGIASTTVLARSEDVINEVENLIKFAKAGEAVPSQEALKAAFEGENSGKTVIVGQVRNLYKAAIEVAVLGNAFFGQSNTDATIAGLSPSAIGDASGFSSNPPSAQQGLSASINYSSNVASIPDVKFVDQGVDMAAAIADLDVMAQEIPFGASPLYDAMFDGAIVRNVPPPSPPLLPPQNIMLAASDNDQSDSSATPQDVVDEANAVAGSMQFPIFSTTFIVTDPVSLAARRARTDVADLELISSETGGSSFSVIDPSFVGFVIDRIKTSAPESIGAGTILATHSVSGYLSGAKFVVTNLSPAGNSASMTLSYSLDGYNFTVAADGIQPNSPFSIGTPVSVSFVRYEVRLVSSSFDSPVLTSVELDYVSPNVQYLFTFPQAVSGQVSELSAVVNHRLPDGGTSEVGVAHGATLSFEGDYANDAQPSAKERGVIVAINRSFDTFIGTQPTIDTLFTNDLVVYRSKSGPWPQDGSSFVQVNSVDANPNDFIARPELGIIAFRKKLLPTDVVTLGVSMPQTFRVGVKLLNPVVQAGRLDSFAYMFGSTQDQAGTRINRLPRAVNLFITPSPVLPGGPMTANYTFVDPDGDSEDKTKTVLTWFRNGVPIPALTNKATISTSDLIASRSDDPNGSSISKGQEWFFTVRPNDGFAFGPQATSAVVTIANLPPTANNVVLSSSNKDPSTFTTADTITAKFAFSDTDNGDSNSGTVFTFFANGVSVKAGSSPSLSPTENDANGNKVLVPGVAIRCEVTPSDGTDFGNTVSSATVTVSGTPPSASSVAILPASPSAISNLRLSYSYSSPDQVADASTIAWFRAGARISELDNTKTVQSVLLSPGQAWYAVVTPTDTNGTIGTAVKSNVVTVQF